MTTAAANHEPHTHSHHAHYVVIFIWLVILTAIEVSIPEFVHMKTTGPISLGPKVVAPNAFADNSDPAIVKAAEAMAPTQRYTTTGWAARIGVLAFLALVKAALVGAFFMHLRFDGWKLNAILAVPTVLFVVIMVLLAPDIAEQWPTVYPAKGHVQESKFLMPPE